MVLRGVHYGYRRGDSSPVIYLLLRPELIKPGHGEEMGR